LEIEDTDNFGIGLKGSVDMLGHILAWRKNGTGMLSTPFAEGAGSSNPTRPRTSPTCNCISSSRSSTTTPASCTLDTAFHAISACCGLIQRGEVFYSRPTL
jgi:hypothetical protein